MHQPTTSRRDALIGGAIALVLLIAVFVLQLLGYLPFNLSE
jgi:hypothetical protein